MTIIKYLFITLTLLVMNAYLLVDKNMCDDNSCIHRSLLQDIESILLAKASNFSVKHEDADVIALTLEQFETINEEGHDNDNNTVVHVPVLQVNISDHRDKSVNTKVKHVDRVKMLDNRNASNTNYNVNEEGKYCSCLIIIFIMNFKNRYI